jgi:hypothetical protein
LNSQVVNNSELDFNSFDTLLSKDVNLILYQDKWLKNLSQGIIDVLNQSYSIQHNDQLKQLLKLDN